MLVGLVGKTNTGKSTFFKAATLAEVEIANHPFVTIKPNEGVGFVRTKCVEKEFGVKCQPQHGFCLNGWRFVPVKLLDVAGLVPGAHKGKGLGNQFLDDLCEADVLIHVVDAAGSTNEQGEPVKPGTYDPTKDVRFLEEEIDLWFHGLLLKNWQKFAKQVRLQGKEPEKAIAEQFSGLKVRLEQVKRAFSEFKLPKDLTAWSEEDLLKFASTLRQASKPILIAANKSDLPEAERNIQRLKKEFPHLKIISCSADSELALRQAAKSGLLEYVPGSTEFKLKGTPNKKQEEALNLIREKVLKKWGNTGVQQAINSAVFDILRQIVVYPVPNANLKDAKGNILPDAFLLPQGSTALDLAYKIHEDLGKNFVRAVDIRTKKIIGKDYKLKNRDVIEIINTK